VVVRVVRLKYNMVATSSGPPTVARRLTKAPGFSSQIQAEGRGEDRRDAQIKYDRALKAMKGNTARSIDRVRDYPSQHGEGENVATTAEHDV
jgi:hypothetical protein